MTLSCKMGAYNRVLDELIKMNLSKKDVFLLFGPVDILVQFCGIQSLDEFVTKYFNPIKNLAPDEPLITKTQTLIAISEGRCFTEEPYAFLFLNTQPRNLEAVQDALQKIPQVLSADTVFGPYDVICAVTAKDRLDLQHIIDRIQHEVPHIQETVTEVVASLY